MRLHLHGFLYTNMLLTQFLASYPGHVVGYEATQFLPVTFAISQVASPELPTQSAALHTTVSMQIVGVDLTFNVYPSVLM